MTDRHDGRYERDRNEDLELQTLRGLVVPAPLLTFSRFRKRANILQGTRILFDSQVNGFWIVLDVLLKRLFRSVKDTPRKASVGYSATPSKMGDRV